MAVERETVSSRQFSDLRKAKAYFRSILVEKIIRFSEAKSVVFQDVIDNNFLDQSTKKEIIRIIEQSGSTEKDIQFESDEEIDRILSKKDSKFEILAGISAGVGVISASALTLFVKDKSLGEKRNSGIDELIFGINIDDAIPVILLILVFVFLGLRLYTVIGRKVDWPSVNSQE